jgi:DNA polymerase I
MIAIDTETHLITDQTHTPRLVCVSVSDGINVQLLDADEGSRFFVRTLLSGQQICMHNAAFDGAVIAAHNPDYLPVIFGAYDRGQIKCTQVREKLAKIADGTMQEAGHSREGYSLAACAEKYLGIALDKSEDTWRMRYAELDGTPIGAWPEAAQSYAMIDAIMCRRVYLAQPSSPDEDRQARAAFALHLIGAHGLRTDATRVEALESAWATRFGELQSSLLESGVLRRTKKKIAKDMVRIREMIGPGGPKTPKGAIATSKKAIEESGHPALASLVEYSHLEKLRGSFLQTLVKGTVGPILSRPNSLVATGRTSWREPNIQQLPRGDGIRECFVPREGHVYVDLDYAVAELRSLAEVLYHRYGSNRLQEAFLSGRDPHTEFGGRMIGLDYATASSRLAVGDGPMKQARQLAKAANFGFPGGLGAAKFQAFLHGYRFVKSLAECQALKRDYLKQWKEMSRYFKDIGRACENEEPVIQLYSDRVRGSATYCQAANSYFQGLTADGAKEALWALARAQWVDITSPLYGSRTVAFVHDEFLVECPESDADECAREIARIATEAMQKWTPHVPVVVDYKIMERWKK